jgi:hypothetical protein
VVDSDGDDPPLELAAQISGPALLAFVVVHGVLLWLVVPLGFVVWLVGWPYWHGKRLPLGQFLGWLDLNLGAFLRRSVLWPLFRSYSGLQNWIPLREARAVEHRIAFTVDSV